MELQERLIAHFHQTLELKAHLIEEQAQAVEDAAMLIFQTLVSEGKILTCGNGPAAALAQYGATLFVNRYQAERPGLPALCLNDSALITGISADSHFGEIHARPVRALALPGDVLLVISSGNRSASLIQAIQAAHDRGAVVVALTAGADDLSALLQADDVEIRTPSDAPAQISEVQLLTLNALCALVEYQLFGEMQ